MIDRSGKPEGKLGLIAFANNGGLGAQTRRLAKMLNPDTIMVINSAGFSQNREQHYEWYKGYNFFVVEGLPGNDAVKLFLQGLDYVFCCENPYNFGLVHWGHEQGTKIYCQSNYEFCENLLQPWLPVPDKFVMPSYWMIDEMKRLFGEDVVGYLPPPIHPDEFKKPREVNNARDAKKKRFLHIIGTAASNDRNGSFDLIDSVKLAKEDFELVIRSQHPLSMDVYLDDPRVTYEVGGLSENWELYLDFDALLLPRRWGGLCLPMNEALMSGLPVLMSDITPNKEILPNEWLVKSELKGSFQARVAEIPLYSVIHEEYAALIDRFAAMTDRQMFYHKTKAYGIGVGNFSEEALKERYLELFNNGKA